MKKTMRLGIAQIDCTVGDIGGNCRKIVEYMNRASTHGVDMLSFPELSLTGYPPGGLLFQDSFINDNLYGLKKVAAYADNMVAVVGFVDRIGDEIYNAAAVVYKGKIRKIYHKTLLFDNVVFNEKRCFKNGSRTEVFGIDKVLFGVNISEEMLCLEGPVKSQASAGAGLIINISSSPYFIGKTKQYEDTIRRQAKRNKVAISYVNLVGGQDELVFEGRSMIVNSAGAIVARAPAFKEDLLVSDIEITAKNTRSSKTVVKIVDTIGDGEKTPVRENYKKPLAKTAEIYGALSLGLKDYAVKNGFKKAVLGLSGGIDSSLVAALAVDALGRDNVVGVYMPTHYSSPESERDAKSLAENLGIRFLSISIDNVFKIYLTALKPHFAALPKDVTEENLQARIRGNMLMALSNKFGWLVLATGNKSEISTGYATLYGDMAGGFAVIKDIPKMLVYKLARYRNSVKKVIPDPVFTKEPMAELKHGQKDSDTLPPYEELDPILKLYIEENVGIRGIIKRGFDIETVRRVSDMVDRSEFKRRQAPPGVMISQKDYGKDITMPITNGYKRRDTEPEKYD